MKRRKTRQEKTIADLRRKLHIQQFTDVSVDSAPKPSFTHTVSLPKTYIQMKPAQTTTIPHPYLLSDLRKITILTASIIAFELVLFFLLKNRILSLPIGNF